MTLRTTAVRVRGNHRGGGTPMGGAMATGPGPRLRLVIAEDHAIVRAGVRALLDGEPELEVVGEAASGPEALDLTSRLLPDVALMDIRLPGMSGLAVAGALHTTHPQVRVLIMSAFDDVDYIREALRVGAAGYLLKTASPAELVRAIHSVAAGTVVLDAAVSEKVAGRLQDVPVAAGVGLTAREGEVLALLARGLPNKVIATRLNCGLRTVEGHVTQVLAKLGVRSRTEAAVWATAQGLVDQELSQTSGQP